MWIGCSVDLVQCGFGANVDWLQCECAAVWISCSVGWLLYELFAIWIGCKVGWMYCGLVAVSMNWLQCGLVAVCIRCIVINKDIPQPPPHLFFQNIYFLSIYRL